MFLSFLALAIKRYIQSFSHFTNCIAFLGIAFFLLAYGLAERPDGIQIVFIIFWVLVLLSLLLMQGKLLEEDYQSGFLKQIYLRATHFYGYIFAEIISQFVFLSFIFMGILPFVALLFSLQLSFCLPLLLGIFLGLPSLILILYFLKTLTLMAKPSFSTHFLMAFPLSIPWIVIEWMLCQHYLLNLSLKKPLLLLIAYDVGALTILPLISHFFLKEALDS
jgi:heme exporter protein CcmB